MRSLMTLASPSIRARWIHAGDRRAGVNALWLGLRRVNQETVSDLPPVTPNCDRRTHRRSMSRSPIQDRAGDAEGFSNPRGRRHRPRAAAESPASDRPPQPTATRVSHSGRSGPCAAQARRNHRRIRIDRTALPSRTASREPRTRRDRSVTALMAAVCHGSGTSDPR